MCKITDALTIGKAWLTIAPGRAIRYARWSIRAAPADGRGHCLLVESLLKLGQHEAAANATRAAVSCSLDPGSVAHLAIINNSYGQDMSYLLNHSATSLSTILIEADIALKADNTEAAISHLQRAILFAPSHFLPFLQLAIIYQRRDNNLTLFHFEKAIRLAPAALRATCIESLFIFLFRQEMLADVAFYLNLYDGLPITYQALYLFKTGQDASGFLAASLPATSSNERFDLLVSLYTLAEHDPHVWDYLSVELPYWKNPIERLALHFAEIGNTEQAIPLVERLITLHPQQWEYDLLLASLLQSPEAFNQVVNKAGYIPQIIVPYAKLLNALGDYSGALDILVPCLSEYPANEELAQLTTAITRQACTAILL